MATLRPILGREYWTPTQNIQEIEAQKEVPMAELEFMKQRWGDILGMYKTAFEQYGSHGAATVPSEFGQAVSLFQPGGQYGAGTEAAIAKGQQQEIAAGNIAQAQTGMSSGTTALARTNAAIRNAVLQRKLAEERRLELLGGALTTAGQAGLTAQELDAVRQAQLLQSLSRFS